MFKPDFFMIHLPVKERNFLDERAIEDDLTRSQVVASALRIYQLWLKHHFIVNPAIETENQKKSRELWQKKDHKVCQAGSDGDCNWEMCPQLVEYKNICPLWVDYEEY